LLETLRQYCHARGAYFIRELTVDMLESFKAVGLPGIADITKSTKVAQLRCFLREAFRREWITQPLVERVTPYRATQEQKDPYSDTEVAKILEEAERLNGGRTGYSAEPHTFRLLLDLMLATGMRVGDAVRFDPKVLRRGDCLWIYPHIQQKRRKGERLKTIEAYISDNLKSSIDACAWLSPDRPFMYGSGAPNRLGTEVWKRMQTIGSRCGVGDCRPHRLRDTFAVRALLRGMQLEDVSRLLGHSSVKVTEAYYAKWVTSRTQRLERLLAESLVNP
jgi:integrase